MTKRMLCAASVLLGQGGALLVIETAGLMEPGNAWAWTHVNGMSITPTDINISGYRIERTGLLKRLVRA
jgi:hypothetical protein